MTNSIPMAQSRELVPAEEEFVGQFSCYIRSPIWFQLFLGPLNSLLIQPYLVSVSKSKLRFSKLNYWGNKIELTEVFDYSEVSSFKTGRFLRLASLRFQFNNGNDIKLKATFLKENTRYPQNKILTQDILDYLQSRIVKG